MSGVDDERILAVSVIVTGCNRKVVVCVNRFEIGPCPVKIDTVKCQLVWFARTVSFEDIKGGCAVVAAALRHFFYSENRDIVSSAAALRVKSHCLCEPERVELIQITPHDRQIWVVTALVVEVDAL